MSRKVPNLDPENPEWTEEDFARAQRADQLPAEVLAAFPKTRGRGPGKRAAKVLVSLRLDPEVVAVYRGMGEGWQSRMNADLSAAAKRHARAK